ncbi:SNARE-complex protein Syntaxin-18 N-terminal [Kalmanozyma brasiliensis GHG001]|nr:SNARE-complex protein Syntaxin-18 N-terminal [Kalmanozyma brasiliensis GHG001]EST09954.2 SNARE-complex protein Syntaxin-18 N-terminal [Kalmanozyma brasiliensis GHG001]
MAATRKARVPPSTDLTADFQQLLTQRRQEYPPSSSSASGSRPLRRKDPPENVVKAHKQWLNQAYIIRKHIISLLGFLHSIRRKYLALGNKSRAHHLREGQDGVETPDDQDSAEGSAFAKWKAFTGPLTDMQRDEIDFQVKVVIKRCLESIKELEQAEEARKKNAPTTPTALSPLNSLLALSTARDSSTSILASSLISAHRASITQYLSMLLSKASSLQSDMQEARLRVQREKTKSLANSRMQLQQQAGGSSSAAGSTGTASAPTVIRGSVGGSFNPELDSELGLVGKDISAQLSASQIEMFETESSELIKSLESDLAAIKKAESRLYEISELQTQVVQQLEQQGEITDLLLDEAIGVGTEVGRGNEELRKARQRSREADKFLSIFLVGSGLALLFLHWMD